MALLSASRPRLLTMLALVLFAAVLSLLLQNPNGPFGDGLLRASYDTLHQFSPMPDLGNSPVVIIYLDLQAHLIEHQNPNQVWPRELHAQLLQQLTLHQPRAVVFDIVFSGAGASSTADESLATAIRDNGRVLLAAEHNDKASYIPSSEQPGAKISPTSPPYEPLRNAAAGWGIAALKIDDDFAVRKYLAGLASSSEPSLTWAAASFLNVPVTREIGATETANQYWVRYYGPALTDRKSVV